jgi:hypothetical protein
MVKWFHRESTNAICSETSKRLSRDAQCLLRQARASVRGSEFRLQSLIRKRQAFGKWKPFWRRTKKVESRKLLILLEPAPGLEPETYC